MLFNRDNKGSEELLQVTGYAFAANVFDAISTEIEDATRTVAGLVGSAVVNLAQTQYDAGTTDGLVAAVRTPIAILAVARYSRANLVTHTDNGSKVVADGNEKMPWEWMIDRDERAQQDRWYRALDALYAYLDENSITQWQESDAYKRRARSIVRTMDEMEAVYPLDGSFYVFYLLQNLVVECQGKLRRMMNDDAWSRISGASVAEADRDLLRACQRWAVLSALVTAVRRWSLEVFPLSIVRRFCPSYQGGRSKAAATMAEMDAYVGDLEKQIADTRTEIAELLLDGNPWQAFNPLPENDPANKYFTAQ
ncbi:MAG: hypothetical protein IJV37_05510 [Bacteroidales bacterium]|nr:hypothetical protein [Bacteroidales bacterium]